MCISSVFETDAEADDRMLGPQPSLPPHSPTGQKDTCEDVRIAGHQAVSGYCQLCVHTHSKGINNHLLWSRPHSPFFQGIGDSTGSKVITWRSQTLSLDAQNSAIQVPLEKKNVLQDYGG